MGTPTTLAACLPPRSASASRPRPPATSTSAGPARPCSTGCSPATRGRVAAADRGHRRRAQPARADRGHLPRPRLAGHRLGRRARPPVRPPRPHHVAAAERLLAEGHAYRCDCTQDAVKARNEAAGGPPGYDGFCRDRDVAARPRRGRALPHPRRGHHRVHRPHPGRGRRSRTPTSRTSSSSAAHGLPMFLVANAVDDADMGITHIIRGEDLINVTPKVLLLRQALGIDERAGVRPPAAHRERASARSSRSGATTSRWATTSTAATCPRPWSTTWPRWAGARPTASRSARSPRSSSCSDLEDVNKRRRLLRPEEARPLQRRVHPGPARRRVRRALASRGCTAPTPRGPPTRFDPDAFAALAPLVQERVKRLDEVPGYVDFLFLDEPGDRRRRRGRRSWSRATTAPPPCSTRMLDAFADVRVDRAGARRDAVIGCGRRPRASAKGKAQAPVRVAVTGRSVGPPLLESLARPRPRPHARRGCRPPAPGSEPMAVRS